MDKSIATDDSDEEGCEFIDMQDVIDQHIKDLVSKHETFEISKTVLEDILTYKLDSRETLYVGQTYVDCCVDEFLHETDKCLRENVSLIISDTSAFTSYLRKVSSIDNLCDHCIKPKSYSMLVECNQLGFINKSKEHHIVNQFKYECFKVFKKANESLSIGDEFIREIQTYIRGCFKNCTIPFDIERFWVVLNKHELLDKVLEFLRQRPSVSVSLRNLARKVVGLPNRYDLVSDSVHSIIDDFYSKPKYKKIKKDRTYIIQITGSYIRLWNVDHISEKFDLSTVEEVRVYAGKALRVDVDLCLPGINVVLVAPEVFVIGDVELNVSGQDGQTEYEDETADDGKKPGYSGRPGKHGSPGESGGNVLICADVIKKAKHFFIKSNGGNGSDGQNGGSGKDGEDGEDGYELSESEFKSKFPDRSYLLGKSAGDGDKANLKSIPEKNVHKEYGKSCYVEGKLETGNEVTLCIYEGVNAFSALPSLLGYPTRTSYCLVKGTNGTQGQKGGDGGKGGMGGTCGLKGIVKVMGIGTHKDFPIAIEALDGHAGENGQDGKGGKGGKNGKRGADIARCESNHYRDTRRYCGNLKITHYSSDSSERAWCPHKNDYVEITEMDKSVLSSTSYASKGEKGGKKSKQQDLRSQSLRKTSILVDEIIQQYEDLSLSNESYSSLSELQTNSCEYSNIQRNLQSDMSKKLENQKTNTVLQHEIEINKEPVKDSVLNHVPRNAQKRIKKQTLLTSSSETQKIQQFLKTLTKTIHAAGIGAGFKYLVKKIKNGDVCFENDAASYLIILDNLHLQLKDTSVSLDVINDVFNCVSEINPKRDTDLTKDENVCILLDDLHSTLIKKYRFCLLRDISTQITRCTRNWLLQKQTQNQDIESVETMLQTVCAKTYIDVILEIQSSNEKPHLDTIHKRFGSTIDEMLVNIENIMFVNHESDMSLIPMAPLIYIDDDGDDENVHEESNESNVSKIEDQAVKEQGKTFEDFANMVSCLDPEVQKLILKLRYVQADNIVNLVELLCQHFEVEGLGIEFEVLQWLIIQILTNGDTLGIKDFLIIFCTYAQNEWLFEYVMRQLSEKMDLTYLKQIELKANLIEHKENEILLYISRELQSPGLQETSLTSDRVITILELSSDIEIDDVVANQLQEINIADWPCRLQWFRFLIMFQSLSTDKDWDSDDLVEAAYCMSELCNKYGTKMTDKITEQLEKQQKVSIDVLLTVLRNLRSGHWKLDNETLEILQGKHFSKWRTMFKKLFAGDSERDLDELINLMSTDSNISIPEPKLCDIREATKAVIKYRASFSRCLKKGKRINEFNSKDIKKWTSLINQEIINNNFSEVIAVVDQGVYVTNGFRLRDTQLLSIVTFFDTKDHGMLQQIATGEGKSLIIAALSIILALTGQNVDVITSSAVLAERDAVINQKLFDLFSIRVGHNVSKVMEERKLSYVKNKVIYGEVGAFQRDLLLSEFYNEDIGIGSREQGYVIVDEVDSMLLDKGENVLYLSHTIPGIESLEPVYVYIWHFVHSKEMIGTADDVTKTKECMMNAMYGAIRKMDIFKLFQKELGNHVWNELVNNKTIDSNGRILIKESLIQNRVKSLLNRLTKQQNESLICLMKDIVRQGNVVNVPKFLTQFIDLHLQTWIENAFMAKYMVVNDNYIIDIDRTDGASALTTNVIIMDKNTGVEQYHSQWNNGLHQFLQLKHGCRLSLEQLKAVFMSNVTFFNRYSGRLFGLTGTLGSVRERSLLRQLYHVGYATIPSFCPSHFMEEMTNIQHTKPEWIRSVVEKSRSVKESGRPVLVICDSVNELESIISGFDQNDNILVYKRSYDPLNIGNADCLDAPCIIVATNLAGRGTDLKVSKRLSLLGGLYVILTNVPPNIRIEEQAFGRAARKGQNGSGKIICLSEEANISVVNLKVKRNMNEENRIDKIKDHYEKTIKVEEKQFNKFKKAYHSLERYLESAKKATNEEQMYTILQSCIPSGKMLQTHYHTIERCLHSEMETIDEEQKYTILQSCLDKWAFYLDRFSLHRNDDEILTRVKAVVNSISKSVGDIEECRKLVQDPARKVQLAKCFAVKKKYTEAYSVLKNLIEYDNQFAEAAHYYAGYCLLRRDGNGSKNRVVEHMRMSLSLIREKCELLSTCSSMVYVIGGTYKENRESFLIEEDYKKQKTDMIEIFSTFSRSIEDILGYEVSSKIMESYYVSSMESTFMYQDMFNCKVLNLARVTESLEDKITDSVKEKYQMCLKELCTVLLKNKGREIQEMSFSDLVPNREEFWSLLVNAQVLIDQHTFVAIDKQRIKETVLGERSSAFLDQLLDVESDNGLLSKLGINECKEESSNLVCLYHEQIENYSSGQIAVIYEHEFDHKFGNIAILSHFENFGFIQKNKLAVLSIPLAKRVQLNKYDGLNEDAFTEIHGLEIKDSRQIFSDLIEQKIISDNENNAQLVGNQTPSSLNLSVCNSYKTEVLNILSKNFTYRLALNELLEDETISLPSKPHVFMFDDLKAAGLIEGVHVNQEMSQDQIKKTIESVYGHKLTFVEKRINTMSTYVSQYPKLTKRSLGRVIERKVDIERFWTYLKRLAVIDESGDITCTVAHLNTVDFASTFSLAEDYTRFVLAQKENVNSIVDNLFSFQSGLAKYDELDAVTKELYEYYDMKTLSERSAEINVFLNNGLSDIVILSERKWTAKIVCKIIAIILIGVAQIVIGIIIEVFTMGFGTLIAAGFIGEGIGDIMFAMECAYTGYCSFADYGKHKMISLAITILTAGVGAYFSRGAKFSKFGFKIGHDFLRNSCGKELIKKAGKQAVLKACRDRTIKKIAEAGVLGLTNVGVNMIHQKIVDGCLEKLSNQLVGSIEAKFESNSSLSKTLDTVCRQYGIEQARHFVSDVGKEYTTVCDDFIEQSSAIICRLSNGVCNGLGAACKKIQSSKGNGAAFALSQIGNITSKVVEYSTKLKAITEISVCVDSFISDTENNIKKKLSTSTSEKNEAISDREIKQFREAVLKEWRDHLCQIVKTRLSETFVRPMMQSLANSIVRSTGQYLKKKYKQFRSDCLKGQYTALKNEFEANKERLTTMHNEEHERNNMVKELTDSYHVKVNEIVRETRDPVLLVEMIKEDIPVGIHCAQAIAELTGRPLIINTTGGDDLMRMPSRFNPSVGGSDSSPIVINFEPGDGTGFGHYYSPDSEGETQSMVGNNCLFEAVSTHIPGGINRDQVADVILSSELIKERMRLGIHTHFMDLGGVGGVHRRDETQERIDEMLNKLMSIKPDEPNYQLKRQSTVRKLRKHFSQLRDTPAKLHEAIKATGNDELLKMSELLKWAELSKTQANGEYKGQRFDHLDLWSELRVDTKYVVWEHEGGIHGHSGAVYNEKQSNIDADETCKFTGMRTKGQKRFHENRSQQIEKGSNAKECAIIALVAHLNGTISPEKLRSMKIEENCYVTSGDNLKRESKRQAYCNSLERERYKNYLVLKELNGNQHINGLHSVPNKIKNDPYIEKVKVGIKKASNLQSLGKILRDPAPMN